MVLDHSHILGHSFLWMGSTNIALSLKKVLVKTSNQVEKRDYALRLAQAPGLGVAPIPRALRIKSTIIPIEMTHALFFMRVHLVTTCCQTSGSYFLLPVLYKVFDKVFLKKLHSRYFWWVLLHWDMLGSEELVIFFVTHCEPSSIDVPVGELPLSTLQEPSSQDIWVPMHVEAKRHRHEGHFN